MSSVIDAKSILESFDQLKADRATPMADEMLSVKSAIYTDTGHFENELENLITSRPQLAGTSGMLPEAGSVFDVSLGGVPIIVVRDEKGEVNAFVNACRHRGSPLVTSPGRVDRVLRCPYHAWSFKLDGSLQAMGGHCGGFDALDKASYSLVALPVREANGLIWVLPSPATPSQQVQWPDTNDFVGRELEHFGLPGHRIFKRRKDRFKANWKLILDTFTETYHISALHRDSIHPIYHTWPNLYAEQADFTRIVTFRRKLDELRKDVPEVSNDLLLANTIWSYFGPNAVLTRPIDHFELWQVEPVSVDECEVTLTMLVPDDDSVTKEQESQWHYSWDLVCAVVHEEDFKNQQSIQASLAKGLMDRLVFGRNEPGLIHFHKRNLEKLGLLEAMTIPA